MNSTSFSQNILILALDSTSGAVRDFHRTLLTTTSRVYKGCRIWLLDTRVCKFVAREFPSLSPPVKAYISTGATAELRVCRYVNKFFAYSSNQQCPLHLTGLDLVPLQPDLSHLRSSDLGSRIRWVQANWLVYIAGYSGRHSLQ